MPYSDFVKHFFAVQDPTTFGFQGEDMGQQYSSVIFTHGETQEKVASEVKLKMEELVE